MKFQVKTTPDFEKSLKKIAKKHKSILQDFSILIDKLENEPKLGIPLGHNLYKIRLNITSFNKGKSGGARVITYVKVVSKTIFLVEVYLKSEYTSVDEVAIIAKLSTLDLL